VIGVSFVWRFTCQDCAHGWLSVVPVYDARGIDFQFPDRLPHIARDLPVYEEEIPLRSLVIVLYSANTYKKKGSHEKHLSLNIQAAIVLGTMPL
jgi:hypothetical protein